MSSLRRNAAWPWCRAGRTPGRCALGEAIETGARSTNALGLVEEALRQAQLERAQIECLAVGLGPGSYNGIRLAIALAQGWQLARPVKLLGISSAECLAAQAQAEGIFGRVQVVIDAQRERVLPRRLRTERRGAA